MDTEVMMLFQGKYMQLATVVGRIKDKDGKTKGTYNDNRYIDTYTYAVMFPDGLVSEYAANIMVESIHSEIDHEGYRYQILDHISDCWID